MSDIFGLDKPTKIKGKPRIILGDGITTITSKEQGVVSIVARILATENLTVVRANCKTASFNIKTRVLMLPIWKGLTLPVEDMLMSHEVCHALWTPEAYGEYIKNHPPIKTYLNVLEDVRIERFGKDRYPGLKRTFHSGYTELQQKDFFGIQHMNLKNMLLIDKINMYFKAGYNCGVTFNEIERDFVARAEKTLTIEEVNQLAEDIFKYSKEVLKERQRKREEEDEDEGFDENGNYEEGDEDDFEDEDFDEDPDSNKKLNRESSDDNDESSDNGDGSSDESSDSESDNSKNKDGSKDDSNSENKKPSRNGKRNPKPEPEIDEKDLESKTDKKFSENLKNTIDGSTEYHYYGIQKSFIDPIVPYKQILAETAGLMSEVADIRFKEEIEKQKRQWNDVVSYMIMEFEARKAAQALQCSRTAKLGEIDEEKLYAYKISNDLFKTYTIVPKGKNHGIVILMDWSSSMDHVIVDCIKQVINLVMFCQKEGITFQALAFTSGYSQNKDQKMMNRRRVENYDRGNGDPVVCRNESGYHLLELFNSKMSLGEFKQMILRLMHYQFRKMDNFSLGGTPLNEALLYMSDYLGKFQKKNGIEKLTFITLTDGEGQSLSYKPPIGYGNKTNVQIKRFMKDPITRKDFDLGDNSNPSQDQTVAILEMIKARYNCSILGFYIMENNATDTVIRQSLCANSRLSKYTTGNNAEVNRLIGEVRNQFKEERFAMIESFGGRDILFMLRGTDTKIKGDFRNIQIENTTTNTQAAKMLSNELKTAKTSRILLTKFIDSIS